MFKYAGQEDRFFNSLEANLNNPYKFEAGRLSDVTDKISQASILLENLGYLTQSDELVNFIEKLAGKMREVEQFSISDNESEPMNILSKDDQISKKLTEIKTGLESIDDFDNNLPGLLQDLIDVVNACIKAFRNGDFSRLSDIVKGSKEAFDFICNKGSLLDDDIVHNEIKAVYIKYNELLSIINGNKNVTAQYINKLYKISGIIKESGVDLDLNNYQSNPNDTAQKLKQVIDFINYNKIDSTLQAKIEIDVNDEETLSSIDQEIQYYNEQKQIIESILPEIKELDHQAWLLT